MQPSETDRALAEFDVAWRHDVADRLNAIAGLRYALRSGPLLTRDGLDPEGRYQYTLTVEPYFYLVMGREVVAGGRESLVLPPMLRQVAAPHGGGVAVVAPRRAIREAAVTEAVSGLAEVYSWATLGLAWWHGLLPPHEAPP